MKLTLHIGTPHEEEVIVYANKRNALTDSIEQLVNNTDEPLVGYKNETAIPLQLADIFCFTVENNHVFACTDKDKLLIKTRLYKIEELLPCNFVKINQSCIVNLAKIQRFETGVTGTLAVILFNGFCDYVSRRNLKMVKERMGLKK
ncbi:MAG: LytTR family transcriptional regulator [Clostridia bacterium]|nr:LytTR family transcriptional regulator [Clostridia bacterium]